MKYDVVIVGGGMSGITAAIGLSRMGLSVGLIEAVEPTLPTSPSFDQRAVALSACSIKIFQSLDLWSKLKPVACPIEQILVSDQGHFGATRLTAKDYNLDALGEVIPLDLAGPLLWSEAKKEKTLRLLCPAKLTDLEVNDDACELTVRLNSAEAIQSGKDLSGKEGKTIKLSAQLVIAADGTYSHIAQQLGMDISRQTYSQHAVITNIETELAHHNRAYERFTVNGPLALLPLSENRLSLVWCHRDEQIEQVMQWSESEFTQKLQQAFGFRLGKITKVGQRFSYPLSLHVASQPYSNRILLLGNAAHTLHPIAGQGFNLGLRDVARFIERVELALENAEDISSDEFLTEFYEACEPDWQQTTLATDALVRVFSQDFLPLSIMRNKAMTLVNNLPFLKLQLANAAMGFSGCSSRLARGIKLSGR